MPDVKLYINNQLCDLVGDESIEVDYTIFDITKIGSRGGARSYEFNLPKTNRNKAILENPEMVNNLSAVVYDRNPAIVLVDGVDMLIRFAEVTSVKNFYAIRLYGGNSGFYDIIRDLYLKDLSNICDYQHYWSYDNVVNSRHNTSGYIYPLVDWHTDSPNSYISDIAREIEVSAMLPALFFEQVIQKTIEDAGYVYVNNAPADEVLLLPCSVTPKRKANAALYEGKLSNSETFFLQDPVDGGLFSYFWGLGFDTIVGGCSNFWSAFLNPPFPTFIIYYGNKISFKVEWNITIINTSPNDFNNITLVMSTDVGTTILPSARNSNNYYEEVFSCPAGQEVNLQGSVTLITDSRAGLQFDINYFRCWIGGLYKNYASLIIQQKAGSSVVISDVQVLQENPNVFYLDTPNIDSYITVGGMWDYKQIEVIKNYCLLLGLMLIVDEVGKRIIFEKFDKVLSNLSLAYDWSNIIDESEEAEIVFLGATYGQESNFIWKSDEPEAKPAGTDGTIHIDNKNLKTSVDVVVMDYASSYSKILLDRMQVPTIPIFTSGVAEGDLTPRVLYHKKYTGAELTPSGDLTYYRSGTLIPHLVVSDDIPVAWFLNTDKENNLGFANNILETRYTALEAIIQRYKNLKILVRLSASDINQIDFTVPVFIRKYESYFYISSIKGFSYTESKSTLVELVKLNING